MENKSYPVFITEFSDYLRGIKNYSNIYVKNLIITLKQFLTFINIYKFNNEYESIETISLNDIRILNNSDIYSFIYFLAENHYKQSSRIVKIEHLRTFFDYLYRIRHNLFKEPFCKIKREKDSSIKLPNYLSLNEAKRLIKVYANSNNPTELRDSVILHLGLNCGLRVAELSNLKINDINLTTDTIVILGKGNKERIAYLNKSTKNSLLKYLEIRKSLITSKKDKDFLFLTRYNKRMPIRSIQKSVKKAYRKASINEDLYSVHTLRHTCATLMYKAGINIKTIKEVLGHVKIDTTEIYTHLHDDEVMKAIQSHPLAQFKIKDAVSYCT